jgi:membrane protein implicated in regulation of membrane protease activity
MHEANFIHGCISIIELLATIAIIVIALGTIVRLVTPADLLKYCGVIVGITVVLILLVSVLVSLWVSMSLWQNVVLAVIASSVWRLRQRPREPRKKTEGE